MKRLSLFFFLMIGLIQVSFSQGEFLKRGKSGFGAGIGFSTNREMNGKTAYAGFSYKGIIDIGLTYWKMSSGKIQDGVFTPSLTLYPIKQEVAKKVPTLGFSIGYSRYKTQSMTFLDVPTPDMQHRIDTLESKATVNAIRLGVTAYHRIGRWKIFSIQPLIGMNAVVTKSGWEYTVRAGVSFSSRIKRGPLVVYTPSIESQSGVATFIFTVGLVI